MRVDDIANRLRRHRADRGKQARAFARAAAGIDHRDRIVADDEADIGGVALVGLVHHVDVADVNVDAGRDLGDGQRRRALVALLRMAIARRQAKTKIVPRTIAHEIQCPLAHAIRMGMPRLAGESTASANRLVVLAVHVLRRTRWRLGLRSNSARTRRDASGIARTLRLHRLQIITCLCCKELPKLFLLLAS